MSERKMPENIWELLELLKKNNVPKDQFRGRINSFLELKSRDHGVPFTGHFELTHLCNLDCKMCYVHLNKEQIHDAELLTVEQWKRLMWEAKEAGMRQACMSGGECLTYPGFEELYLYLQSMGVDVAVYTNGLLLDERRIEFFVQHPPIEIQISIYGSNDDGYEAVTGKRVFDIVSCNIENAIKAELPVHVAVTPSKFMDEDVENIYYYLQSIGAYYTTNISLHKPRENTGRQGQSNDLTVERYAEIYQIARQLKDILIEPIEENELPPIGGLDILEPMKGIRCGAGRSNFAISWDGVMHPCGMFQRIKTYPLIDGFTKCWQEINNWAENYPRISKCCGCAYDSVCDCCAAYLEEYAAPGEQYLPWCERTRTMVKHGIKHIEKCV